MKFQNADMGAIKMEENKSSWYSTPNPLLEGIPAFIDLADLINAIAFNPLENININNLSFIERDALLTGEKVPFEPTMQSTRAAMTWYGMLTNGLRARNPIIAVNRAHYWDTLKFANQGSEKLPLAPSTGISINVVKGPTGTGKTVTQLRFCACLPQVIDHGRNDAAHWNGIRQLVYLKIDISHDGSRGGFLQGILQEMDRVLGTKYLEDLTRRHRTVEKLAVATIARLVAHYTGILFIDEAQLRNLVESGQAELMQMFLLALMNAGIPLVLSGNERAFDWITSSQDQSRLNLTPHSIFAPIGVENGPDAESEWAALSSGITSYYVLKNPITDPEKCSETLWRCSGGIARLALTLWCNAQRNALFNMQETICPTDIQDAYDSISFAEMRPIAEGFYYKKPELLALYPDIDARYYANLWKLPSSTSAVSNTSTDSSPAKYTSQVKNKKVVSGQSKLKREQNQERKKAEKLAVMMKSMSRDDIRRQGTAEYHLDKLSEIKSEIEKEAI